MCPDDGVVVESRGVRDESEDPGEVNGVVMIGGSGVMLE